VAEIPSGVWLRPGRLDAQGLAFEALTRVLPTAEGRPPIVVGVPGGTPPVSDQVFNR